MPLTHRLYSRHAFSLIELLVVIVIVAILGAIIYPALRTVVVTANDSTAASNLRQLATAQLAYASDNNLRLPTLYGQDQVSWQKKILPYLDLGHLSENAWLEMRMDPASVLNVPDSLPADEREYGSTSVAMNYMFDLPGGFALNSAARPGSLLLIAECTEYNGDALYPSDTPGPPTPAYRRENQTKALAAFCDGHVSPMAKEDLEFKYYVPSSVWWEWEI